MRIFVVIDRDDWSFVAAFSSREKAEDWIQVGSERTRELLGVPLPKDIYIVQEEEVH